MTSNIRKNTLFSIKQVLEGVEICDAKKSVIDMEELIFDIRTTDSQIMEISKSIEKSLEWYKFDGDENNFLNAIYRLKFDIERMEETEDG